MANKVIEADELTNAILDALKTYTDDVKDNVQEEIEQLGKETKDKLKAIKKPQATESGTAKQMTRRDWNEYSKGWTTKKVKDKDTGEESIYIYNSKKPHLTHLLELGHATKNGSRTRAFKHIEPITEETAREMETKIKQAVEKTKVK